jgi:hypothetical protein
VFGGGAQESKNPSTSASSVADRRAEDLDRSTGDDAKRPDVSASAPLDTDDAIRTAAKLAIDAGDVVRARALLDLLDAKPKTAAVLTLAHVRHRK